MKINKKSLLAHTIDHGKSCQSIDEIIISTDCKNNAAEGKKFGVKVPFFKPYSLATDTALDWKVWQHALKFYYKKNIFPSILVILSTTSPLRKVDNMIDLEWARFIKNKVSN